MDLRRLRYFVAVAEERHFGRAAERLHIAQPSLSRAIKQLEHDLGVALLERSPARVAPTAAGEVLLDEARTLLGQVERARARVVGAVGLTVGTLGTVEGAGARLVAAFRRRHPHTTVHVRESDFADPTAGLRAGLVDVALTRSPFEAAGLEVHRLRSDPVGAVLRTDDPLASRTEVLLDDLADRRWFRFPEGTDRLWSAWWTRGRHGPVVRTAHECLQAVLWNGNVGLVPLGHDLPAGLVAVPLADHPPSDLVIARRADDRNPLVRAVVAVAAGLYGDAGRPAAAGAPTGR